MCTGWTWPASAQRWWTVSERVPTFSRPVGPWSATLTARGRVDPNSRRWRRWTIEIRREPFEGITYHCFGSQASAERKARRLLAKYSTVPETTTIRIEAV